MKNLFTLLFFSFIALTGFSQAPQKFSYQTVVRNASNQLLVGQTVGIKISILQGSSNGSAVYTETHAPQTNANGLATLEIGGGSLLSGNFANINWANGPFFVKTETDPNGGNNYTITNTSQLLSVPYALYSSSANTANTATTANNGVPAGGTNGQFLTNCNGVATWTTAGQCPGTIASLSCVSANNTGTLTALQAAAGVSSSIPYTGGGGGSYNAQTVNSTGVTGLTATLTAGSFANGAGSLTYTITGTSANSGTANFALNIGGQTCTLTRTVNPPAGTITVLSCSTATNTGTLIQGVAAANVSISVSYTGGNGGTYTAQNVTSTGATGLTATLAAGTLLSGAGSLNYIITGTPAMSGIASFELSIGGQSCTLEIPVNAAQTGPTAHNCGAENVHNPNLTYGSMTDQDGNMYKTIVIGNQELMAENLKVRHYRNGDLIPNVTDNVQWSGLTTGAWCYFNNDPLFECPYGLLYNWYTVSDPRNLCPTGWHAPSDAEWIALTNNIGGQEIAGGKMKTTGLQYWINPNQDATNESGFSGLPGSARISLGSFSTMGNSGYWWSSTENVTNTIRSITLYSFSDNAQPGGSSDKRTGFSVRCLRD